MRFDFAAPDEGALKLARPVPHPWLRELPLTWIGALAPGTGGEWDELWALLAPPGGWSGPDALPEVYADVVAANARVARLRDGYAPRTLVKDAVAQLTDRVQVFFDVLLTPAHLRLSERALFSARTVLAPGMDLTLSQVGLPEAMAWALFGPLAIRELGGDATAVETRSAATDGGARRGHGPVVGHRQPRAHRDADRVAGVSSGACVRRRTADSPLGLRMAQCRLRRRPSRRTPADHRSRAARGGGEALRRCTPEPRPAPVGSAAAATGRALGPGCAQPAARGSGRDRGLWSARQWLPRAGP